MPDHIIKLKGKPFYFAALNVPVDVQELLGKKSYKKSLKTDHRPTAVKLAKPIVALWQKQIDTARQGKVSVVSDKIEQLKKLLIELKDDISAAEGTDEHLNLSHAQAAIKNEVAELLNTDINEASEPEKIAYLTAIGERISFDDGLEEYLDKIDLTEMSKDLRRHCVLLFTEFVDGKTLDTITKDDVLKFQTHLEETTTLMPRSIKNKLSTLRLYYKQRFPKRNNIFADITYKPNKTRKADKRRAITVDELKTIRDVLVARSNNPKNKTLLHIVDILRFTGARINEVCSLKVENISLSDRTINITNAKSDAGDRLLPIHNDLLPLIEHLVATSKDGWLINSDAQNKYGLRSGCYSTRFGRIKKELGFDERVVAHSIRKLAATLMERGNVPMNHAAQFLGHEKVGVLSFSLYSDGIDMEQMRKVADVVADGQKAITPRMITEIKQLGS